MTAPVLPHAVARRLGPGLGALERVGVGGALLLLLLLPLDAFSNRVDVDAIREGIKRQEEEKEQRAADADALKRAEAGAKAARYRMWKDRRRHCAGISSSVASMVQRWSVQADAGRKRDRLLDIYTSCNRINLRLWNEVSQPEIPSDVDMDAWKRLCRNYADACALTGMVILVEGVELDLRLPWLRDEDQDWLDAPPPDQNEVDLSTADPPS